MNENIKHIKLLLAKFDGDDVDEALKKYKDYEVPYWYEKLSSKDAVFKFSSSKVPDKYTIRSTTACVRGLRFDERRPDTVEVIWVGKDFDIKNNRIKSFIYSDVQNALAAGAHVNETLIEQLQRHWFVKQIGKANG